MRRPVILNGIDDLATRSDLIDHAVCLTLPAIRADQRQDETTLWRNFEAQLPYLVCAMLNVLSAAMLRLPSTEVREAPRMADFARWSIAAEQALGWNPGGFISAFRANQQASLEVGAESSVVAEIICHLFDAESDWQGTAADLLEKLNRRASEQLQRAKSWPRDASKLGNHLRRIKPALGGRNIEVDFIRPPDSKRTRLIHLHRTASPAMQQTTVHTVRGVQSPAKPQGMPNDAVPSTSPLVAQLPTEGAPLSTVDAPDGADTASTPTSRGEAPAGLLQRLRARFL